MKQKSIVWRVLAILLLVFLYGGDVDCYATMTTWGKLDKPQSSRRMPQSGVRRLYIYMPAIYSYRQNESMFFFSYRYFL